MKTVALQIATSDNDSISALLYPAATKDRASITLILAHGAGAGQMHPFMRLFATGLAERGLDVLTFNFQYMEHGKGVPDPKAKLEACYFSVIEAARNHKKLKGNRLVIGGKSMGGRIASQVAADWERFAGPGATDENANSKIAVSKSGRAGKNKSSENQVAGNKSLELTGLVFLGYPLHPPGRPDKLRDAHLPLIKAPMLFVQGSRDAFGSPDELRATIQKHHLKNATLHIVAGGDHSLKVPKSQGSQEDVYSSTMDLIAAWRQGL